MSQLTGKVALITGGSSGIGLESAKKFASKGAHVFVAALIQEIKCETVVEGAVVEK